MASSTNAVAEARLAWASAIPWGKSLASHRIWLEAAALLSFIAAILSANYALAALPNVKLFDLIVFVAGYTLGFRRGAAVAVGAWLVYGTINPWGTASALLLATLMTSELAYALAGTVARRLLHPRRVGIISGRAGLLFAAAALIGTLTYDAATNVFTGVTWAQMTGSSEYGRWVLVALFNPGALTFSAFHIGSNLLFFSLLGPALVKGVEKGKEMVRWEE